MSIKILTAVGLKHEKYLPSLLESTSGLDAEHLCYIDTLSEGKAVVMNRLLRMVKDNDLVAMLDADDMALMTWFDNVNLLDKYDLIYGDTYTLKKSGKRILAKSHPFDKDKLRKVNLIQFSGVIMKGWLAKSVDYPNFFGGEDWLWWNHLTKVSDKFYYTRIPHTVRRDYTSHISRKIPIYSKIMRLKRDWKVRRVINQ